MKALSSLAILCLPLVMVVLTACQGSPSAAQAAPIGDEAAGEALFLKTCAACHGPDGRGLPGLGKDLVSSDFVAGKSNRELVDFIKTGRGPDDPLNTTGVTMPPRGNNSALTDEDLYHIVAYLRMLPSIKN